MDIRALHVFVCWGYDWGMKEGCLGDRWPTMSGLHPVAVLVHDQAAERSRRWLSMYPRRQKIDRKERSKNNQNESRKHPRDTWAYACDI